MSCLMSRPSGGSASLLYVCALLSLLCVFPPRSVAQTENAPAFLDSPTQIRVWLDSPLPLNQLKGKFSVRIEGKEASIASVAGGGEAEKERRLPRTAGRVILAGTLQAALGGKAWDADGDVTQTTEEKPGVFALTITLPRGRYEFKVTRDGSWRENYGASFERDGKNIALTVPADRTTVKFVVDFNRHRILNSLENPAEVVATPVLPSRPMPPPIARFPVAVVTLTTPLRPDQIADAIVLTDDRGKPRPVIAREILSAPTFYYGGADLGSRWSKAQTSFKVWSPVSRSARLLLFPAATGGVPRIVPMTRATAGVWAASIKGDLNGVYYQYEFQSYGKRRVTPDINCFAASPDSRRSLVIDLRRTNPSLWPVALPRRRSSTDAVIYELSVRDFTVRPESGVPALQRGKYAGMIAAGTRVPGTDFKTGLDYLVELGVTDIHLLPVQNFLTGKSDEYSWGYATNLFNVPEETYSMTPDNPLGVVREFKQMVAGMHQAGLRVVLDVVYNHTWPPSGADSAFWQTVPYYYFRTNDRGDLLNESGVGNALNDDHPMVRKFVRDSLLYWLTEYNVDGFRFDLLGMFRRESVVNWANALRAKRPDVQLYGEPWTGGGPTRFGKGQQRGSGVAVFNDDFRSAFRGDADGSRPGFALGGGGGENFLQKAIRGSIDARGQKDGFTDSPQETINYVSAHDNLTLWDKVAKSLPAARPELRRAAVRLAAAATLLSQGIPFIEGGTEIGRAKGGNANSFDAGDAVNGYDWAMAPQYADIFAYYQGLIRLRKAHPVFRLRTADAVRQTLRFLPSQNLPQKTIAFTLSGTVPGDPYREYFVILHGATERNTITLPVGTWAVLADAQHADAKPHATASGTLPLEPLSAYVLAR